MGRKIFQVCLLLATMVLIAFGVSWFFSKPPAPPVPRPLPNPNGYPLLVQAGMTLSFPGRDLRRMDPMELHLLVDGRSNELQLARTALAMECQVPLEFTDTYRSNHTSVELSALRKLAQTLLAEGRLAEAENRTNDAVNSYLDAARLGAKSARGGNVTDAMVSSAIVFMSLNSLRPLMSTVDAGTCRDITATLEGLDAQRESWQKILANDSGWQQRSEAFSLKNRILRVIRNGPVPMSPKDVEKNFRAQLGGSRRAIIEFAARTYELEHGQKARSFADLVPVYLNAIPQDPSTGTNMLFMP
jgi:hypothetical protein